VVAHTVLKTPDDGCKEHPKHVEKSCCEIKYRLLSAESRWKLVYIISSNAELNPICHLLALLGAHHILHVSGLRVKKQMYQKCSATVTSQGFLG
jgi:hypothetical protein